MEKISKTANVWDSPGGMASQVVSEMELGVEDGVQKEGKSEERRK